MEKETQMLNKIQRFILVCVVAVAILAGCEAKLTCHIVPFKPNAGWQYRHNVWYGDLGQVVGVAEAEDSTIYACTRPNPRPY